MQNPLQKPLSKALPKEAIPKTIICDIDGTLIKHATREQRCDENYEPEILPNVQDRLLTWDLLNYNIILLTGRKESCRKATEAQLRKVGIPFDQLVMGVGRGIRCLINDSISDLETALAYTVVRNKGLGDVCP